MKTGGFHRFYPYEQWWFHGSYKSCRVLPMKKCDWTGNPLTKWWFSCEDEVEMLDFPANHVEKSCIVYSIKGYKRDLVGVFVGYLHDVFYHWPTSSPIWNGSQMLIVSNRTTVCQIGMIWDVWLLLQKQSLKQWRFRCVYVVKHGGFTRKRIPMDVPVRIKWALPQGWTIFFNYAGTNSPCFGHLFHQKNIFLSIHL